MGLEYGPGIPSGRRSDVWAPDSKEVCNGVGTGLPGDSYVYFLIGGYDILPKNELARSLQVSGC